MKTKAILLAMALTLTIVASNAQCNNKKIPPKDDNQEAVWYIDDTWIVIASWTNDTDNLYDIIIRRKGRDKKEILIRKCALSFKAKVGHTIVVNTNSAFFEDYKVYDLSTGSLVYDVPYAASGMGDIVPDKDGNGFTFYLDNMAGMPMLEYDDETKKWLPVEGHPVPPNLYNNDLKAAKAEALRQQAVTVVALQQAHVDLTHKTTEKLPTFKWFLY